MLNVRKIQKDFPILKRKISYLDNAATSQKPREVIKAISDFYSNHNANVHRGLHTLSGEASELYDDARKTAADFLNCRDSELIFTKNTTDGLNLVSHILKDSINEGDEIVTTILEHHSSLIPWQEIAKEKRAILKVLGLGITKENLGDISDKEILDAFRKNISSKTKVVAISHASNVFGLILPIKQIVKIAKEFGATVVVDGAQALPHIKVNLSDLGCDFYSFSGHKMLAPFGIGVLFAKKETLSKKGVYQVGGGMINIVENTTSTYLDSQLRYEAGTPNVEGAIGLAKAVDYINTLSMRDISTHEQDLSLYCSKKLQMIPNLSVLGPKDITRRTGLISFVIKDCHAHDIAAILDNEGVAVRSGHHCTMPLHTHLGISGSTRASWYIYNDKKDIDRLYKGLLKAVRLLS